MGLRGPPPKPTALKILAGNPGEHALNKEEPQPEQLTDIPPMPPELPEGARQYWEEIAPMLFRIKCMTEAERRALSALCLALYDMHDVRKHIDTYGRVVKDKNGKASVSPYLKIQNESMALVIKLLQEFGLTPASRSRIIMAGGSVRKVGNTSTSTNNETQIKSTVLARRIK